MVIKENSVQQINTALINLENRLKNLASASDLAAVSEKLSSISSTTSTGAKITEGTTYAINISGNAATASTASYATRAGYAESSTFATSAQSATNDSLGNAIDTTYMKKDWTSLYDNSDGSAEDITMSDNLGKYNEVCIAVRSGDNPSSFMVYTMPVTLLYQGTVTFGKNGCYLSVGSSSYLYVKYNIADTLGVSGAKNCYVVAVYAR